MLQINPGEIWLCRGGCKARIYATDGWEAFPIHGAVFVKDEWFHEAWRENGAYMNIGGPAGYDLIRKLDRETDDENA